MPVLPRPADAHGSQLYLHSHLRLTFLVRTMLRLTQATIGSKTLYITVLQAPFFQNRKVPCDAACDNLSSQAIVMHAYLAKGVSEFKFQSKIVKMMFKGAGVLLRVSFQNFVYRWEFSKGPAMCRPMLCLMIFLHHFRLYLLDLGRCDVWQHCSVGKQQSWSTRKILWKFIFENRFTFSSSWFCERNGHCRGKFASTVFASGQFVLMFSKNAMLVNVDIHFTWNIRELLQSNAFSECQFALSKLLKYTFYNALDVFCISIFIVKPNPQHLQLSCNQNWYVNM